MAGQIMSPSCVQSFATSENTRPSAIHDGYARALKRYRFTVAAIALFVIWSSSDHESTAQSSVSAPVLMWQYGGCLSGPSCQTGWYSSPAVADLDGDGRPEVIWGAADVVTLDGTTGSLEWRASSSSRIWPGIAVADLNGDSTLEVIVGRDSDQLTVYNRLGSVIWTRNPFGGAGELRARGRNRPGK